MYANDSNSNSVVVWSNLKMNTLQSQGWRYTVITVKQIWTEEATLIIWVLSSAEGY